MSNFHLRGTGLEDHSLLNEDQVVVKKNLQKASRGRLRVSSCRCWAIAAFLAALWLAFFGLWLYWNYFRDGGGAVVKTVGHNVNASLMVLPQSLADKTGAYCLDGSPPSYYFRNASSQEHHYSWIIHLLGGSWCYNNTACAHRSTTDLGSSRLLKPTKTFGGILSANFTVNPDFFDWNLVVVNYCDGASFSGTRGDPVSYNNTKIYYRGARVLDAVVNYLLQSAGLEQAERILLSGESAGALAVYLHADHISSMVPDEAPFKALADGGFFVDEMDISGDRQWETAMKDMYQMQHVQWGLDEDCLLAKGSSNKWECFFPQYAYPYVTTPIFVINAVYDRWVQRDILGLYCHPEECDEALGVLQQHRQLFLQRTDQVNRYLKDGMFLTSCYAHCQAVSDLPWMTYAVAGRTVRKAFADWYFERKTPAEARDVDCTSYNCNPTCSNTWELNRSA
ncbi:pectin acetylesterase 11-like [Acanthaster planci]|uniref:Pectin acetylesterase 11-like n=1 Tax=Acanthaster planci TaxID=133434 RepID=A0A8B8A3I4_ACAPL|nr:pectin acetylesterase 11-like [Acanthaster planci]XP_022110446.1 pectin acetylesterase 11-like [Acanthaster planci]